MPATTKKKCNKYGGGYSIFNKNDKVKRRHRRSGNNKDDDNDIIKGAKKEEMIVRPTVTTFDDLISELDYSYDSLATINVIFDSLRFTWINSKEEIERLQNNTRLGDMEKELLTAYDDLSLQINHLEKDITKMEENISKLKSFEPTTTTSSIHETEEEEEASIINHNNDDLLLLYSPSFSSSSSPSLSSVLEAEMNSDYMSLSNTSKEQSTPMTTTMIPTSSYYWD